MCACVFHCFHNNCQQKMPSGTISPLLLKLAGHGVQIWFICVFHNNFASGNFPITPSLLKLAHHTMHGGETWHACVFKRFHDNQLTKLPWVLFPITISKLAYHAMNGGETWYTCVFQHLHDNHEQKMASGTFSHNYFFTS